jgi:hypothetical protein
MNSNMVHNVLNALVVLVGAASFLGCVETPAGFDCSASFIGPKWGAIAAIIFGGLKIVINIGRDGLGGLIKEQPPVASKTTTVVVAQPDTAAPKVDVTTSGATVVKKV